jgi:hypothetical protein
MTQTEKIAIKRGHSKPERLYQNVSQQYQNKTAYVMMTESPYLELS